jgi:hypothetical protein
VYDAGSTELGRPYFAMEHVDGEPITDCCDRHRLSVTGYEAGNLYSRGDIDGGFGAVFAPPSGPGVIPFPPELLRSDPMFEKVVGH